jgi:tetrahydromethanopterin S-methyltransferase subunit C
MWWVAILLGLAVVFIPEVAFAQAGGFDQVGQRGWQAICQFLRSPIVTVIAAAVVVGLLIAIMANEENKVIGRILQILIGVALLLAIPGVLSLLGLPVPGC